QMLHTTLVLSIVLSFCLLNRNFPPNNPSALSIFNYRLGLFYLTDLQTRGSFVPWVNAHRKLRPRHTILFWSTFSELSNRSILSVLGRGGHIWRVTKDTLEIGRG